MAQTFTTDAIPSRSGGSELIDYSLKESDRKLILERRKVQLIADKGSAAYSAASNDTISIIISPGAKDEWLDGRSSFITASISVTPPPGSDYSTVASQLALTNGPAACFSQVQVISASGQQLVNILDYANIQQMFTEWTACPTWKGGIGQMYGSGTSHQWKPAQGFTVPAVYSPYATGMPEYSYDSGTAIIEQRNAGDALALQATLATPLGVTYAFRLDLAWLFGNPTLIPSQYFPLQLRCTLAAPAQSLTYIGANLSAHGSTDPRCIKNGNPNVLPGITAAATALPVGWDLKFANVKFMASLCKVSPTFQQKVESEMAKGLFSMTVTNYYTAQNSFAGTAQTQINTSFAAHDNQAFYVNLVPQANEQTLDYDWGYKWGGDSIVSSQLLLNGRYFPSQPNTNTIDMFHDTLQAFATHSENVDYSPVSYSQYLNKSFLLGTLLDRDAGSSLTGVSSISSPVWTHMLNFKSAPTGTINVHTCIAYTQVLEVLKEGQIKIFQ